MKKQILDFLKITEATPVAVGDTIELRDFSSFLPETGEGTIPWNLRDYRLLDSRPGKMLYSAARMPITPETPYDEIDFSTRGMPEEIVIPLPLKGRFAICAGEPNVDLALGEEGFIAVKTESGGRYGRMIGKEEGREYFVFWRKADLDSSFIRIRIPYGTFSATSLSFEATLSCLRFVRIEDDASLDPVDGKPDKDFIMVCDGGSHTCMYGIPGECFDLRLNRAYDGSDVRIMMTQVMGPLLWKSDVNSFWGEGMTAEDFDGKRICDVRNIKYVRDSIKNGYEALRVQTADCHERGMEMLFSIRANLYMSSESKYIKKGNDFMNGRWWREHPECRLPDSNQLDYGKPEVRKFYYDVFQDALERFDIDGINLDLTRWPKCLDARYHTPNILISFCRELRSLADEYGKRRNKHIKVSLLLVEYYHSYCTLEEQAVDFEGLMRSGTLDFVCLETDAPEKYSPTAHKYGVRFFGIIDTESPYFHNNNDDPLWKLPDGSVTDDPCAGEEFKEEKYVPTWPAPFEQVRLMDRYYENGADGVAKINEFMGALYFRDCGHSDSVRRHAEEGSVFGQTAGDYLFFCER